MTIDQKCKEMDDKAMPAVVEGIVTRLGRHDEFKDPSIVAQSRRYIIEVCQRLHLPTKPYVSHYYNELKTWYGVEGSEQ